MTPEEARKILGLKPGEDPRPHFADFQKARDHIGSMVRSAPDPEMTGRYLKGLVEFDEALAIVKQDLKPDPVASAAAGGSGSGHGGSIPSRPITVGQKSEPVVERPSRMVPYLAWFAGIFVIAGIALWFFLGSGEPGSKRGNATRVAELEREGTALIESRRWQEAHTAFAEMEKLSPGSEAARKGRLKVEAGMTEEQNQFIGYWTGQATAELEAGRLDEAEAATRQVLEKYPAEKDAAILLKNIAYARVSQTRNAAIAAGREALDQKKWNEAATSVRAILDATPEDPEASAILADAKAGMAKAAADEIKALDLLKMAVARDQGQFDQQALDWLREAKSLAPGNAAIAAQLEKQSAYTRTIRVPGDFATPAEALAGARDRDRIVLAAGDWKGPLVVNAAVELQGAGAATTRVGCSPEDGSAITIGPDAKGARISGISFRHESFAIGTDRFSVALVRGGTSAFADCKFLEASGHGLAVIEGGKATVSRCRASGNGWNGIAATGQGTTLEVSDSECLENFQHGIESWDGAAAILVKNRCEGNSRNGIHADNGLASATIEGNQLLSNREFGLVLDSAGSGKVTANTASENLLGGFVIRAAATAVTVTANQATLNQGPGLVLEKGLQPSSYASNSVSRNGGQQILTDADLSGQTATTPAPETAPPVNPSPPEPAPAAIPRARIIEEP